MQSTELQECMRQIWEEALQVPVTESTEFFSAGGHSFLALDIIARAGETLHMKVPLRLLFNSSRFTDFVAGVEDLIQTGEVK
jgi:acyl carrier protein